MIFWSFSEPVSGGNHTAVAKGKLSADEKNIENPTVIFRATPTYDGDKHYGSRLEFDKDGYLFVSTGERSDLETRPFAQKQDSYLGKDFKNHQRRKTRTRKSKHCRLETGNLFHRPPKSTRNGD
jgi:glucose/arabinose dehydrogenase